MSENTFWNFDESLPFFKWTAFNMELELEKPIMDYEPIEKEGQYGISCYIPVKCNNEISFFKVDSKRLRKALVDFCATVKKYPVKMIIQRIGTGFNTDYRITPAISQAKLK